MNISQETSLWKSSSVQTRTKTAQPSLRFSGYDPRAAGGRQTLKLELPEDFEPSLQQVSLTCRSELFSHGVSSHSLLRSPAGMWPPVLLSFSTKTREHGQYPLEIHLTYKDVVGDAHLWVCTSTILLPRANASLSEIHQVFLAAQKQYRVHAEDGAIAKLSGLQQEGIPMHANWDVDIYAKDAAIAQLDLNALTGRSDERGQHAIGLTSIAWYEALIEIAVPTSSSIMSATAPKAEFDALANPRVDRGGVAKKTLIRPAISRAGLLAKDHSQVVPVRLLAGDEWCLGRKNDEPTMSKLGSKASADIELQHLSASGAETALTKRISRRHAIIRRQFDRVEITDISRYGLLLDGVILEKHQAMPLFVGNHLALCASFKGIVELRVAAIHPHVVLLQRLVDGKVVELFYLLNPEQRPEVGKWSKSLHGNLLFFHHHGQFWHHDPTTLRDGVLEVATTLANIHSDLSAYQYEHDDRTAIETLIP